MHLATSIVLGFETALSNLVTVGSNVYRTRGYPRASLPALTIRAVDLEPIKELSTQKIDSFQTIETLYHVSGGAGDLDEQIFEIDAEVWAAIMADRSIGGLCIDTDPQTLTIEETSTDATTPTAIGIRRWRCHIRHSVATPES